MKEDSKKVHLSEQIKSKMMVGDFVLASNMMKMTTDNVRMRFKRRKQDVLDCLLLIVNNREELINHYQNK